MAQFISDEFVAGLMGLLHCVLSGQAARLTPSDRRETLYFCQAIVAEAHMKTWFRPAAQTTPSIAELEDVAQRAYETMSRHWLSSLNGQEFVLTTEYLPEHMDVCAGSGEKE